MPQLADSAKLTHSPHKQRPVWAIVLWSLLGLLVLLGIAIAVAFHYAQPYVHAKALQLLQQKFNGNVEVANFHVSLSSRLRVTGSGLVVRYQGRTDIPPLMAAREFSAEAGPLALLGSPWRIERIQLKGLIIHIPPRHAAEEGRSEASASASERKRKLKEIKILVHELDVDDTELHIIPGNPQKPEHIFRIHQLVMYSVGLHRAASFTAHLTNYKPPGEIVSSGNFGPWNAGDPGQTPLAAAYTFKDADLGVFKGISGTLSSQGEFGGVLEQLAVRGKTDTPNFQVTLAGHPVDLKTVFEATVDGTNGNTMLHPVRAIVGHTTIVADGAVLKEDGQKGRAVELDVSVNNGRIEDLMLLGVKSEKSPLTGNVSLHTKFDLPTGQGDVTRRLKLVGKFGVNHVWFTDPEIRAKVQSLSRRAQGKPEDKDAGSSISELQGQFALGGGIVTLRNLIFQVPGAHIELNGTYALADEKLNFYGTLKLDAKLSQMTTGLKSFFLKAVDPFFRKGDVTELPIKITGTREHPSFGLDLHHKEEKQESEKLQEFQKSGR